MNIIVCIKRTPDTTEAEIKIDPTGKDIIKDRLVFDINEADNYALEEAILLKEKLGGQVTVITFGDQLAEDTLRMALAKGADNAIRIDSGAIQGLPGPYITAKAIADVIKEQPFDVIFTGCIATDDGYSQVGPTIAELLNIPHATLVNKIEIKVEQGFSLAKISRELEGGLNEVLEIKLPALFATQTGINKPRYASLLAIRRAAGKEIKIVSPKEIEKPRCSIDKLYIPPITKKAEIIEGTLEEIANKFVSIIKEKGFI